MAHQWHRIAVIAICCLAPLLTSCSTAAVLAPKGPEAGDKARCATWTKPKGMVWVKTSDFAVLLPKGWTNTTKTEYTSGAWASFLNMKALKSKFADNIGIDRTTAGTDMSVAEMNIALKNDMRNVLSSEIKYSKFKAATPLSLGGVKAAYLTGTGKVRGIKINLAYIAVTDRTYRYSLVVAATPGSTASKAAFIKNLECSWTWQD